MEKWDVIIVGGGPAGLSTALHLARRDAVWARRVLVLEKARYPRHKLCGGGITELGTRCLAGLGLDVHDIPTVPIGELRMVRGNYRLSFREGHGLTIVRRDVFDAYLASKVIDAGVALHQGEAVIDVKRHPRGVTVRTADGTYEARTLVVADGSNGPTRRKLDLEDEGRVARVIEILTPVEDARSRALFDARVAVFDFTPSPAGLQGYYWDFPCVVNGEPHVNRGVYDARTVPDRERADLKSIFAECLALRGLDIADCDLMGAPIHWYERSGRFSRPHVLLAGDSAGADPLLGEGIAFALGYGAVAADAIVDAFARKDFRYADYGARVLASEYGRILDERVGLARELYRHKNPVLLPSFVTKLANTMAGWGLRA